MPPKKEKREIKPALDDLEKFLWWEYREYDKQEIEKVEEFFLNFQQELKDLIVVGQTFEENIQILSKQLGIWNHPNFKQAKQKEEGQLQQEEKLPEE